MATAPKASPLPQSITRHAEFQARKAGISPEQWLAHMSALCLDTEEGTREFFLLRSASAKPGAWREALASVPPRAADAHDAKD